MRLHSDGCCRWLSGLLRGTIWAVVGLILLVCALGSAACFVSVISQHLVGPYNLLAVDDAEDLGLYYDSDHNAGGALRIEPVVIDVGWDDRYLVTASRHPGEPGSELSYYYIDRAKDHVGGISEGVVFGPYSQEEFGALKVEMDLPEFTVHYPRLR